MLWWAGWQGYALHNEKQLRDLEREMAILGSIQHDGIISVRALVEEEPLSKGRQAVPMLYLEFPYCSGGNLNTWLAAAPRAPWDLQVGSSDRRDGAGRQADQPPRH